MNGTLSIVQAILAVLLIIEVLLQQRGSGMGMAFGGSGEVYGVRRGAEKFIFIATVITAVLFFIVGIVRILIEASL